MESLERSEEKLMENTLFAACAAGQVTIPQEEIPVTDQDGNLVGVIPFDKTYEERLH